MLKKFTKLLKKKKKNILAINKYYPASRKLFILIFFASVLTVAELCRAQEQDPVTKLIQNSPAADALWAVQVRDSSGNILVNYHGERIVRPASNLKLLMAAVYLDELGSGFTYKTNLYGFGNQQDDVWKGDLIVEGKGDPSVNGDFYNDDPLFLFGKWFRILKEMGIKRVDGNIIGNTSYFDDVPYPEGWEWNDLSFYYGVEISALSFNSNVVDLEVLADGEIGSIPEIQWFPFNTGYVDFINEQVITSPNSKYDESYRRISGTNTILLRSKLPAGYYESEPLSVANPALYFVDTFSKYLEMGGIRVEGQLLTDGQPVDVNSGSYRILDRHESPPMSELVKWMNKESDNFFAEMILKTVAAEKYGIPGSTEMGLEIVKQFMTKAGLNPRYAKFKDASGMAASTLMKASSLNKLLVYMQNHPEWESYFNSMSKGGIDGTLKNRFGGTPMIGKFYGKSGFVSGVRTLSGYLDTENGSRLAVTIATNNYITGTSVIDVIHEEILEYLYRTY